MSFFRNLLKSDPNRMSGEELEHDWIQLKSELLSTCPYKQEMTYRAAYDRAQQVLRIIARRHWHLVLDAECERPFYNYVRSKVLPHISATPSDAHSSTTLQGLALMSYVGGSAATLGEPVISNPAFTMTAVDYLISERDLPMGYFLKGFVMKYGIELFLPPNPVAARRYLTEAKNRGVGPALMELQLLGMHERALSNAKTIHTDPNRYQDWVVAG